MTRTDGEPVSDQSDDNIPFMFADGGQGPITQCPIHKDVLGFSWDSG